ncbi:hypothetical protein, partial [Rivihabitans pingtungensis]|uniref:hypothetical protein n=1 Tax=Rivihabitans pingtungensis TaxID=1054498 RepID=UPI00289FC6BB
MTLNPSQRKWVLIAVALLIFAGVKFWLINTYLTRQHAAPQAISCPDLQAGCTLPGGARVRFLQPARHGQRFGLELSQTPVGKAPPVAEFAMAGMDMGSARFPLRQVGDGRWQADIMLPVCVTGRQDWLMLLTIG